MKPDDKSNAHSLEAYIKRATSTLVILQLLSAEPMYAYQLRQVMKTKSDDQYTMPLLYHLLYKIEEQGYIEVVKQTIEDNRARSYYGITVLGKERLIELKADYHRMIQAVDMLLKSEGG